MAEETMPGLDWHKALVSIAESLRTIADHIEKEPGEGLAHARTVLHRRFDWLKTEMVRFEGILRDIEYELLEEAQAQERLAKKLKA